MPRENNPPPKSGSWSPRGRRRGQGEGRAGTGKVGALPPPPHRTAFSPPHAKISCGWVPPPQLPPSRGPCPRAPGRGPSPLPRSRTLLPQPRSRAQVRAAAPGGCPRDGVGQGPPRRAPQRGALPRYLLSRQAIHSVEEEEWAACAATMLGSGAVSPLQRPPALTPPPPGRSARPPATSAAVTARPGLPSGGREGTRGAGRGDREGPSRPPCAALRRPGVGSPAVPPAAGRALW